MTWIANIGHLLPSLALLMSIFGAMALCAVFETLTPARKPEKADPALNIAIGLIFVSLQGAVTAGFGPVVTFFLNACGGGLITLPSAGWGLVAGIAIYWLVADLGDYLFHRAQHAWPWMWAMHSLHHSDPNFGATTTIRHFWFETILKTVTIYLVIGVLFRTSPMILLSWAALGYWNFLSHSNVRVGFGAASWVINSPQYHRLHHSALAEHVNCNFAAVFPIYDLLFGAYRRPRRGEYPVTGIDAGEHPKSLLEAVVWPLRSRMAEGGSLAPSRTL